MELARAEWPPMNAPPPIPRATPASRTITYELTRWDVFANSMTVVLRNRLLQWIIPLALLLNGAIILLPKLGKATLLQLAFDAVGLVIGFGVFLLFCQTLMALLIAFLLKQRGLVGQHTLMITEEGLIERTDFNETLHKWASVCRVMSLFGYVYIYVGDLNSHPVPKRCFNPQEIDSFVADVRNRATHLGQ